MIRFSASVATTAFVLLLSAAAVPAQTQSQTPIEPQSQPPTVSVSKVRIVRISQVRGTAQLDRSNGHGFEPAIANLPVVEQNSLKTAAGIAEVEFEDNSTLRLGQDSEAQFVELGRTADGATISTVRIMKGTAYVSLTKAGSKAPVNQFTLALGDRMIPLQPDTHLRLQMDDLHASLAVLGGTVRLDSPNGGIDLPRNRTASFALTNNTTPIVASGIPNGSLDEWDKQQQQYHARVASFASVGGLPYAYGSSDLNYYGTFADAGCGMMWRPYFTSAAWTPYSNGTWAYYSGAGYSWVSPYPWAWTPYHYGSWSFCPSSGWGWTPGGSWAGLNNITMSTIPREPGNPGHGKGGPTLPTVPEPPRAGQPSMVVLNRNEIVSSGVSSSGGSFVFRKDSAGLGVPRGELGNLRGFSQRADRSGQASTPVYFTAGGSNGPDIPFGTRGISNAIVPVAVHRGFSPPPVSSGGFSSFGGGGGGRTSSTSMPSSGPAPSIGGAHR